MKNFLLDLDRTLEIARSYPTPFHIYDETGIRSTARDLNDNFSWTQRFKNYFAVKALPNPAILKILKEEGMGVDCSSLAELILAERAGFTAGQIMFTSNDTTVEEFKKAAELKAFINLDDITHISFLEDAIGNLPEILCFRYNPGTERIGNDIIGNPAEAKYGLTHEQLIDAYKVCAAKGVRHFGLHTMLASNELDPAYFIETARMLFELAIEIKKKLAINLDFINLGGGFGIPYLPDQSPLDIAKVSHSVEELYQSLLVPANISPTLFLECGRYMTGPHGYLVSKVLHLKQTYRDYIGLDASMSDLMRPGMYGAYHYISVLGKEGLPHEHVYDVTGSLCENNDKFAIQRSLPEVAEGDIIIIHDTGAHGHAMGFNYNGKLRSAELLMQADKDIKLVRRAETLDDYFATLKF